MAAHPIRHFDQRLGYLRQRANEFLDRVKKNDEVLQHYPDQVEYHVRAAQSLRAAIEAAQNQNLRYRPALLELEQQIRALEAQGAYY